MVVVHAEESVRCKERDNLTQRANVPEPSGAPCAYQGLVSHRLEKVHIGGVDGHPAVLGKVEEDAFDSGHVELLAHVALLRNPLLPWRDKLRF